MDTDTKVRPEPVTTRTEHEVAAPPSRNRLRTILAVVALLAVIGLALVTAALISGEPVETAQPQPSVSPVQVENWGRYTGGRSVENFDELTPADQHEVLRFWNAVHVQR
jgi:glucose dehydrogenase